MYTELSIVGAKFIVIHGHFHNFGGLYVSTLDNIGELILTMQIIKAMLEYSALG